MRSNKQNQKRSLLDTMKSMVANYSYFDENDLAVDYCSYKNLWDEYNSVPLYLVFAARKFFKE